jgi:hypothetical protein
MICKKKISDHLRLSASSAFQLKKMNTNAENAVLRILADKIKEKKSAFIRVIRVSIQIQGLVIFIPDNYSENQFWNSFVFFEKSPTMFLIFQEK